MKQDGFEKTLRHYLPARPFHPFALELTNGSRVIVDHPEAVVMRGGVSVFVDRSGQIAVFDEDSVVQFTQTRSGAKR